MCLEFSGTDNLMEEYNSESRAVTTSEKPKGSGAYKRGAGQVFEFKMKLTCRIHQEFFIFLGLALKKVFRTIKEEIVEEKLNNNEENTARRGKKRDRKGRKIKKEEISGDPALNDHSLSICGHPKADKDKGNNSTMSKTPTRTNPNSMEDHPVMLAQTRVQAKTPAKPRAKRKHRLMGGPNDGNIRKYLDSKVGAESRQPNSTPEGS